MHSEEQLSFMTMENGHEGKLSGFRVNLLQLCVLPNPNWMCSSFVSISIRTDFVARSAAVTQYYLRLKPK